MTLSQIQKLQFSNHDRAESELLNFLQATCDSAIRHVQINTKPESLNSLNGFVTLASGQRYFFKTHTEENEALSSYYNNNLLADAGYPIIQPKQIAEKPGQQIALYEIITFPTFFDEFKAEEDRLLQSNNDSAKLRSLLNMNELLDRSVFSCFAKTFDSRLLATTDAPIHQLFTHRLAAGNRIASFYENAGLNWRGNAYPFQSLKTKNWKINGATYNTTLEKQIDIARTRLNHTNPTPTIVGHGDAHNGNIFVDYKEEKLLYFDPAFAGRHNPLLDIVKPLFHNVFSRWMYFPEQAEKEFNVDCTIGETTIEINHDYFPSQARISLLASKIKNVLQPTVALLRKYNVLPSEWQQFMRSALFCCPFLTVNLLALPKPNGTLAERYSSQIRLLGLALAIELAAVPDQSNNRNSDLIASIFA